MPLCIRQGSKRNDDSVNVEELDWSAESQALIPAEHLWCDFKCRTWAKNYQNKTPVTWTYGIQSFHSLKICCNRGGNTIFKYINFVSIFVATVWKCPFLFYRRGCPSTFVHIMNVQVIGVWWWELSLVSPKVFFSPFCNRGGFGSFPLSPLSYSVGDT